MERLEYGWKVFRKDDAGRLVSYLMKIECAKRVYPVGQWVKPKRDCGPFCLFRTIDACRDFLGPKLMARSDISVRPVEYKVSRHKKLWRPAPSGKSVVCTYLDSLQRLLGSTDIVLADVIRIIT